MRQPFFVTGYQVTEENMESIATWCQGHIIVDGRARFIRVPVDRPSSVRQTKAYVDSWVLLSLNDRGERTFKVYSTEWLEKQFVKVTDGAMNEVARGILGDDEIQEENEEDEAESEAVEENRIAANLRLLPTQNDPRTMNFRPAR
jgi:hypothetical protein